MRKKKVFVTFKSFIKCNFKQLLNFFNSCNFVFNYDIKNKTLFYGFLLCFYYLFHWNIIFIDNFVSEEEAKLFLGKQITKWSIWEDISGWASKKSEDISDWVDETGEEIVQSMMMQCRYC